MALALKFAEEGEFSSRAGDVSSLEAPDVAPSKAFFRWSRAVRELLDDEPVKVQTLLVAMPGAPQQFVQQLTKTWAPVGTLVTSDQAIRACKLQDGLEAPSAAVVLSKSGVKVSQAGNTLVLLVGQEVPAAASWAWLNKLREHVNAEEIVCLDSQLSTIYADQYADGEMGAKLRMLASSAVSDELKLQSPVRPLEVPQFVAGLPAALLTHGELRKRRVRVFVSLRDVSSTPVDVMRSFLPLAASASSVLGALERPLFFQPSGESSAPEKGATGSLHVLYT